MKFSSDSRAGEELEGRRGRVTRGVGVGANELRDGDAKGISLAQD